MHTTGTAPGDRFHAITFRRLAWILILCTVGMTLFVPITRADQVITKQSFESSESAPAWSFTGTIDHVGWLSFGLSASLMASDGNLGWDITNKTSSITLANQSLTGYKSVYFRIDVASGDKSSPYNGYPDSDDSVIVELSKNAGSTWSREIVLVGPNNSYFGYNAATVTYDGDNTPGVFNGISGGRGALYVAVPDSIHQIQVRVTAKTNSTHDSWWLDYARLTGDLSNPTHLSFANINNGVVPSAGEPFSVKVESKNVIELASPVTQNTPVQLAVLSGSGSLSGTVTGQFNAGDASATLTGTMYSTAESGVKLTVTATDGDALTSGTSSSFLVNGGTSQFVFSGLQSTGVTNANFPSFVVQALRPDNSVDTNFTGYVVTVGKSSGSGNITGTLTQTMNEGVATFSGLQFSAEGTYTLFASYGSIVGAPSSSIVVSKAIPSIDTAYTLSVTGSKANVMAIFRPNGGTFAAGVEYGTTTAYGSSTSDATVTGTGAYGRFSASSQQYAYTDSYDSLDVLAEDSAYTLEAWIRPASFTWLGGIITKYQNSWSSGFDLRLLGTGDYRGLSFDGYETNDDILDAGQWYHIAAVNDHGTRHLYINGVEQVIGSDAAWTVEPNSDPIGVGVDFFESARYFDGDIDEVRIWNTARSQAEIAACESVSIAAKIPGLILNMTFDEGGGSQVNDLSTNTQWNLWNGLDWGVNSRAIGLPVALTGLEAETQYHWRFKLGSGADNYTGGDNTFTTLHGFDYGGGDANSGGYYYANSFAASALSRPSYQWITNITHEYTDADLASGDTDDGFWPAVNIGFPFPFFDSLYTSVFFSTNGLLTFGSGSTEYSNTGIPDGSSPSDMIALAWTDFMYMPGITHVYYGGDADKFIISYDSLVSRNDNSQWLTAQIILFADGRIKMQYSADGSSADTSAYVDDVTIGIENADGSLGLQYRYGSDGGRMFGSNLAVMFGKDNTALPIQLNVFNAVAGANSAVHCEWSTVTETNNYGFVVQRRAAESKSFDAVSGFIAGAGTTLEEQKYSFDDANVAPGTYFYRLKQVNMDGTVTYSQDLKVVVGVLGVGYEAAPREFSLKQNFPNPFNPVTTVKFSVEKTEHAVVAVYNLLGQEVARLFEGMAEPGRYYALTLNGSSLASGVYIYRVVTDSRTDVKRMMLVK